MKVCTALNGSGGWPLTVNDAGAAAVFVGTYLPRESSGGRMGLRELLLTVADKWRSSRAELTKTAGELTAWLRREDRAVGSGGVFRARKGGGGAARSPTMRSTAASAQRRSSVRA